jgi:hypothetical protein
MTKEPKEKECGIVETPKRAKQSQKVRGTFFEAK